MASNSGPPLYNERLFDTYSAGSSPVYDILVNDAGSVIIRHSQDHSKRISLDGSGVPGLVKILLAASKSIE